MTGAAVAVSERPEVDVGVGGGKKASFFVDWDWAGACGVFVIGVVLVDPVGSPFAGVCCRGSDAPFSGGFFVDDGSLSVKEASSVGGFVVVVVFSSLVVNPVKQPGPVVVEELVSSSQFCWGAGWQTAMYLDSGSSSRARWTSRPHAEQ